MKHRKYDLIDIFFISIGLFAFCLGIIGYILCDFSINQSLGQTLMIIASGLIFFELVSEIVESVKTGKILSLDTRIIFHNYYFRLIMFSIGTIIDGFIFVVFLYNSLSGNFVIFVISCLIFFILSFSAVFILERHRIDKLKETSRNKSHKRNYSKK